MLTDTTFFPILSFYDLTASHGTAISVFPWLSDSAIYFPGKLVHAARMHMKDTVYITLGLSRCFSQLRHLLPRLTAPILQTATMTPSRFLAYLYVSSDHAVFFSKKLLSSFNKFKYKAWKNSAFASISHSRFFFSTSLSLFLLISIFATLISFVIRSLRDFLKQ